MVIGGFKLPMLVDSDSCKSGSIHKGSDDFAKLDEKSEADEA